MTDDGVVCARCGHPNAAGANFCSSCGARLDDGDKPTITFQLDAPATGEETSVDLDEVPAGGGVLVVRSGPNAGSRYTVDEERVTVGRHPDSDIFLDDITVSRRHVELRRTPQGYLVVDVGSLNGTYVNRERVEEQLLSDGDELQVGSFKLVYLGGAAREQGGA